VTALTNAIVPALTTAGIAVGIGQKPAVTAGKPYVVIWPDAGTRSPVTMRVDHGYEETWTAHCYGITPESAEVARRKLADAVYSLWNTTVDGRTVQYPEQLTALPLSVDRDADPDLYDYAIEWRFRTSLA
jgi:hypothetical protein